MGAVGQWRFIFIPSRASDPRDVKDAEDWLEVDLLRIHVETCAALIVNTWDMECPS